MAKGICCAAQAAGDLGRPLVVMVHRKDGTTYERCGTCEVRPACNNPQKRVFAFRFLPSGACGLAASKCMPTAAGIAQYEREVTASAAAGQGVLSYSATTPPTFIPVPRGAIAPAPYRLPQ